MPCFNDRECCCQLRILRAASTHYSVLRMVLNDVYSVIMSYLGVLNLDKALDTGDLQCCSQMISTVAMCSTLMLLLLNPCLNNVESWLLIAHTQVINDPKTMMIQSTHAVAANGCIRETEVKHLATLVAWFGLL